MSPRDFIESHREMEQILREETIGYLGLVMDGRPYVIPLNYAYLEGRILFHCAWEGQKIDYLKANADVCFTVGRQSGQVRRHAEGDPCHVDSDSVICYGRARILHDLQERKRALDAFNRAYQPDAKEISLKSATNCCAVEIDVVEMTGRREQAGERTYWRARLESE